MSLIENLRKRGVKDIFNLTKIKVFTRYLKMLALKTEYNELRVPEYTEQIVYRMKKCPDCMESTKCQNCGCKSPELFYDKDNFCSEDRWGKMESPEKWADFKLENGIIINPKYVKDVKKHGVIKW
jgi:predicted RNA-binding Zn-ribbon protein involved in translation (DUF1610 family)